MVTIIVAYDKNRIIGKDNALPWRLPEDMQLFKERTLGTTVVMGRKTWESLRNGPKKLWWLPGRHNFVITRNPDEVAKQFWKGCKPTPELPPVWFFTLEHCLRMRLIAATSDDPMIKNWNVIGGETIYDQFLSANVVDRVIASEVDGEYEGDAFFPVLGPEWRPETHKQYSGFRVVKYVKA
jgi:dihydrofolate reductase